MNNSDSKVEIGGVKSENNFGLEKDFPEIRFVKYNSESKTADIKIEGNEYEVLWNIELNEPQVLTKKNDYNKIYLIIKNNGIFSLMYYENGKINIIENFLSNKDVIGESHLYVFGEDLGVSNDVGDILKSEK